MDHPWRRLRDRPDWLLEWDMLPPGLMGSTCHRRRVITLDLRLSQAERRCTIAHELEHVERGPMPADLACQRFDGSRRSPPNGRRLAR